MSNLENDLNDPLAELFGGLGKEPARAPVTPPASYTPIDYTEGCKACGGSGQFRSYTGRIVGRCFKCKGQGSKTFKSSPDQRAKAQVSYAAKKVTRAQEIAAQVEEWKGSHEAAHAWLIANAPRNDFAASLFNALNTYGALTERQLECVERNVAKQVERQATFAAAKANAAAIDVSKIQASFDHARAAAKRAGARGVRWLKLRLDTFEFLDMPANGQWTAAIMVKEGERKLGRIEDGKFTRYQACTDEQLARILAAAADPFNAAKAYGLRFSNCSCCGKELTNPESIKLGIGPICADKYGWGA